MFWGADHRTFVTIGRSMSRKRAIRMRCAPVGATECTDCPSPARVGRFHRRGQTHLVNLRSTGIPAYRRRSRPPHAHRGWQVGGADVISTTHSHPAHRGPSDQAESASLCRTVALKNLETNDGGSLTDSC
jgi:hypothetical protein